MNKLVLLLVLLGTSFASGFVGAVIDGVVYDSSINPVFNAHVKIDYPSYCYIQSGTIEDYTGNDGYYQISFWLYCYTNENTINVNVTAEKSGYLQNKSSVTLYINADPSENKRSVDFILHEDVPPKIDIFPDQDTNWERSKTVDITYQDFDLEKMWYAKTQEQSCDDVTWISVNSNISVQLTQDGVWYICAKASDGMNHVTQVIGGPYYIDRGAPSVSIGTQDDITSASWITITYTANDDHALDHMVIRSSAEQKEVTLSGTHDSGTVSISLEEGNHSINATVYDEAGNAGNSNVLYVCKDTQRPSISLNEPMDQEYVSGSVTFRWSASDNGCAGIDHYVLYVDGNSYQVTGNSYTIQLGEGIHSWHVVVYDKAGNSKSSETRTFTVDLTKPSVSIAAPTCVNDDFQATFYVEDDKALSLLNVSLADWYQTETLSGTSQTVTMSIPISAQSPFTGDVFELIARVYDKAGNSGESSKEIEWDETGPHIVSIAPQNKTFTNAQEVTFSWNIEDTGCAGAKEVYLRIGTDTYGPYGPQDSLTIPLSEGVHQWYLEMYDNLDNTNVTPSLTLTVDRTPPTTTINPDGLNWNKTASFDLSCQDNFNCDETYYLVIPASDSCPSDTSIYQEGNHSQITDSGEWVVCYFSVDKAGNFETIKRSQVFKVDNKAPVIGQAEANVYFDGNTYWAKPGDHIITYATASDEHSGIERCYYKTQYGTGNAYFNGTHCVYEFDLPWNSRGVTFWFEAEDKVGNVGSGTNATLLPDKESPEITLNVPASWINHTVDVVASCKDGGSGCNLSTLKYYVSSSQLTSCPIDYSMYTYDSYTAEEHVWVCAAAYDNVGNFNVSEPAEFKVDVEAPDVGPTQTNISYSEGNIYYVQPGSKVKVFAAASDNVGVNRCEFLTTKGSSANFNGTHCVYEYIPTYSQAVWFKVYDLAGNSVESKQANIIVDGIAPTISITYAPNATVGGITYVPANALITVKTEDDNFLKLIVNGTTYYTSEVQFNAPSTSGDYSINAEAYDKAGNTNSTTSFYTVDADAPTIRITYDIDQVNKQVVFHIYVEDNLATTLRCEINGNSVSIANGTTYDYTTSGPSGSYVDVSVTCYDYVNNSADANKSVYVDWNAPVITLIEPANDSYGNKFVFNVSDEASQVLCNVSVGGVVKNYIVPVGVPYEVDGKDFQLPDGTYLWNVTCNDTYNVGASETRAVKLDTTGPAISVDVPASVYVGTTITIKANISDPAGVSSCKILVDGNEVQATLTNNICTATKRMDSVGSHSITVWANDTLGNENNETASITVNERPTGGGGGGGAGGGITCTADGYACNSSAECCSGLCLDGICVRASEIEFSIEMPELIEMLDNETKEIKVSITNDAPFPLKNVRVTTNVGSLSENTLDFNASETRELMLTLNLTAGEYEGKIVVMKYNKSFYKEFTVRVLNSSELALMRETEKTCAAASDFADKIGDPELQRMVAQAKAEMDAGNYSGALEMCKGVLAYKPGKPAAPGITGLLIGVGSVAKDVLLRYWWIAAIAAAAIVAVLAKARKRELPRGFTEYEEHL